ncbi:50S ribosomal protein L29 [Spiroplasma sp. JKS002669]|uniref:50S ribosomal protein L29 n=1 Tax=Spiroplasma attinicola TaxID=2904537 RepID=UPI002022EFA1|nr:MULTISPECIES: 50S ribosomal protein L29 [unclassified Spiroplasma]MCL6428929.1 50S ribosomal protein L29 [Spiroplasma sp. JKS002669]MCL8209763.1 50S ribosomal protein L29 [Spiroplasma sp. JKS002670]MCL8210579.1 50S ribosomal protein L29 [Spiroplasma sp. JKS002671]
MDMQVIKSKSTLELQVHEEELRAQLFALRIQKAIGKLDTPHKINELRKDIARIKTEISNRALNGEVIKPLNFQKMELPEEKKAKKTQNKKTDKKETKETSKKDVKKASTKASTKTNKVKPTATKTTKSKSSSKEDNNNDK